MAPAKSSCSKVQLAARPAGSNSRQEATQVTCIHPKPPARDICLRPQLAYSCSLPGCCLRPQCSCLLPCHLQQAGGRLL